jgi:GNAT superfamily N-acetyltransferase
VIRHAVALEVRLGGSDEVEAAVSVYERSNLARRHGVWPARVDRLAEATEKLSDPTSWFLLAREGRKAVGMALVVPFRSEGGVGPAVAGTSFLSLIYVLPERWGRGIGGQLLDAVIADADRRGSARIFLWTHERDNERAHRLYFSRGFSRTGVTGVDEASEPIAEWSRGG